MPRRLAFLTLAATLLAAPPIHGQQRDGASVVLPEMTPRLNLGKLNYDGFCAECHGPNTTGTDKGPTFIDRVYHPGHHGDEAFFRAARQGTRQHHWRFGDMKPIEGITDGQLQSIVEYVRATQRANGVY